MQEKRRYVRTLYNGDSGRDSSRASVSVGFPRVCAVRLADTAWRADARVTEVFA